MMTVVNLPAETTITTGGRVTIAKAETLAIARIKDLSFLYGH